MATTTNFSWTTPDDTALVKDGASAIRSLGSAIDTSLSALSTGSSGTWTSYTPTFTNLTVGNGTIVAAYKQLGKIMHVRVSFAMGSTSSVSGAIQFSLPVVGISYQSLYAVAPVYIEDSGVKGYFGQLQIISTTVAKVQAQGASETYVTSVDTSGTIPFTWGTNDFFRTQFFYEVA